MKKIIYFVLSAFAVLYLTACDDNDKENLSLIGDWKYEKPYFEFEYTQDSVKIEMYQGKGMAIAVKDLKGMFLGMATEKMGAYFQGIKFETSSQLLINMSLGDGTPQSLHAGYKLSDDVIQATLNAEEMKALMGDKAAMIPAISFKYLQSGNQLTVYFDEAYIQTVYSMMQDQIVPFIISAMGVDFSKVPPAQQEVMIKGIKGQIATVLDNIVKLRIGFVLSNQ